jgi:hypothetical protein
VLWAHFDFEGPLTEIPHILPTFILVSVTDRIAHVFVCAFVWEQDVLNKAASAV